MQEPIACVINGKLHAYKNAPLPDECLLYTKPTPLTKKQIKAALADMSKLALPFGDLVEAIVRATEDAHGIK